MSAPSRPAAAISTRILGRLIVLLITAWSLVSGLVLLGFHHAGSGALGAGISDPAAQRLFGSHLLLLVPIYLLIAWHPERYRSIFWLPCGSQLAVVLVVSYSMLVGDTSFGDGILAVAVGAVLAGLFVFVWISEARSVATARLDDASSEPDDVDGPVAG